MIDREAQKLTFRIKNNKKRYIVCGAAAAAAVAAYIYFGHFYTGWIGVPMTEDLYFIDRGDYQENAWIKQDDEYYHTDVHGRMAHGIWTNKDSIYVFGKDGRMQRGWLDMEAGRMYLNTDGKAARGWSTVDGHTYYFGDNGICRTGWLQLEDGKYYLGKDGNRVTGWKDIGGKRYYFDENGVMQSGWVQIQDTWYLMADSGEMLRGEQTVDGKTYLLNEDGSMFSGWYEVKDTEAAEGNPEGSAAGKRYYKSSGEAAKGRTVIEDDRYYFGDDLFMRTGWLDLDGEEYFLEEDGTVQAGWHETEEEDFFVCDDGYVPDLEEPTGDYGRLLIRSAGIDVPVYTAAEREEYQSIVDEEESAVAVKERRDVEYVIADRRSQGFVLDDVKEGATAYLINASGEIMEYVCDRVCIAVNEGDDVVDDEGESIWRQNDGGFCTYASAGSEDKSEVIADFWQEVTE